MNKVDAQIRMDKKIKTRRNSKYVYYGAMVVACVGAVITVTREASIEGIYFALLTLIILLIGISENHLIDKYNRDIEQLEDIIEGTNDEYKETT